MAPRERILGQNYPQQRSINMRKVFQRMLKWLAKVDTKDARKSVAADLSRAAGILFALFLASVTGAYSAVFLAIAKTMGVELSASLTLSTNVTVSIVVAAAILRVIAFVLECEIKEEEPVAKGKSKRK
jgi:hypothetical protein